nr:oplophorus-luciferin 2-monooxygenase non-catalytic subunit-like [Penaeus vannamei]
MFAGTSDPQEPVYIVTENGHCINAFKYQFKVSLNYAFISAFEMPSAKWSRVSIHREFILFTVLSRQLSFQVELDIFLKLPPPSPSGTFSGLPNLRRIDLFKDDLRHLQEGAFETSSDSFRELVLTASNVSRIERHAITGLKGGSLWLDDNALASLDEDAFRPLLSDVQAVYLAGNPLSCSCDIAWLVRRPALMARVADDATCNNGQLLVDLDPAMYDALC